MKKFVADICLLFSIVLIIGRASGLPTGSPVFYHTENSSSVTLVKNDGYFIIELLKGGSVTVTAGGVSKNVTVPDSGVWIMEDIDVLNSIQRAVRSLQELVISK